MLQEELDEAQRKLEQQRGELERRDDEVRDLRERVEALEDSSRPEAKTPRAPRPTAMRGPSKRVQAWIGVALLIPTLGAGLVALTAAPATGSVRVYVGNPNIASADFEVRQNGTSITRCSGRICDFKLPPGAYEVTATAGTRRGSVTVQVAASHSMSLPIKLTP